MALKTDALFKFAALLTKSPEKTLRTLLTEDGSFTWEMKGFKSFYVSVNNNGTSGVTQLTFEGSNNGNEWTPLRVEIASTNHATTNQVLPFLAPVFNQSNFGTITYAGNRVTKFVRLRSIGLTTPHEVVVSLTDVPFVPRNDSYLTLADSAWNFMSQAATINTTFFDLVTGGSPAIKKSLCSLKVQNTGTGESLFKVQELTSSPTALFIGYIGPKQTVQLEFKVPIVCAAQRGFKFGLVDATNMSVYVHAQGFSLIV